MPKEINPYEPPGEAVPATESTNEPSALAKLLIVLATVVATVSTFFAICSGTFLASISLAGQGETALGIGIVAGIIIGAVAALYVGLLFSSTLRK